MPIPTLSTPPTTPQRLTDTPAEFVTNMDAWLTYEAGLSAELTAWAAAVATVVSGLDFNGTSTSSVAIGTGSKSWTTQSGKLWQVGQFVIVADSTTPANYCYGQVTAYSSTTLTVNVTSVGGSGTKTAWAIGLAPNAANYATLTGTETFTGKSINLADNTLSGTTAEFNTALSDDDFATLTGSGTLTNKTINLASNTLTGTKAQFNTACSDADFATLTGAETLTNKRLQDPFYTISDGAGFAINPANGLRQKVTLGANRTPTVSGWASGDRVVLFVDDGTGFTIDWSTINPTHIGGYAPTLQTTGFTELDIYYDGTTYYLNNLTAVQPSTASGITYVGGTTSTGTLTAGSTTTPTISLTGLTGGSGSAPVQDDVVVVTLSVGASSGITMSMSSAGWTKDQDLYANGASTSDSNVAVFYKKMSGTPDTSFQLSIPNTSAADAYAVAVQVFRGVDTVTPLDATTTTSTGTATVLVDPPAAPSPATGVNCLVICGGGGHIAGTQTYAASYLTNFITAGKDTASRDATVGMGYIRNIISAYNGAAWTFSGSDNANYTYCCAALLLRAA